jgi:hypothetical protein
MKSRPVLVVFSILAGLDVLFAGAALGDVIGVKTVALGVLATKAVQVGLSFYVQSGVVPVQDVAAYINTSGRAVAGPAAGLTNGTPVAVSQQPPNTNPGSKAY